MFGATNVGIEGVLTSAGDVAQIAAEGNLGSGQGGRRASFLHQLFLLVSLTLQVLAVLSESRRMR